MSVPSNLIPTRVTQLPIAPVADENSLMMIVFEGNNYQIRVGDLLSVAGVPTSRQVIAGTSLQGGGQLSSNVTLSVAPGGIGSAQLAASGVASGTYGTSTDIPVFTVDETGRVTAATTIPATIAGYVPTTRQVIAGEGLSGGGALNANVTLDANLSDASPLTTFQLGESGTSDNISRADHQHPAINLGVDDEVDGILGLGNGGTARSIVADAGAIIWCGADGFYVGPVGIAGQVLVSGGTDEPTWGSALVVSNQNANLVYAGPAAGPAAPSGFRLLAIADLPDSGTSAATYGSANQVPVFSVNAKGQITSVTNTAINAVSLTTGTISDAPSIANSIVNKAYVDSVAGGSYAAGAGLTLTGSTFSITNTAVSSASYGSAASVATFTVNSRGQLTAAAEVSINISASQIGSGTINNARLAGSYTGITGVGTLTAGVWNSTAIGVAYGGTGISTYDVGDINYASGATAFSKLALGTAGYVITAGASAPQYVAQSTLVVGAATNVSGGAAGSVVYQSGAAATSFLALGSSGQVLTAGASAPQYVDQSTLSVGSATNATNATNAANVTTTAVSSNSTYYPSFLAATTGNNGVSVDVDMTYNPSTNTLNLVNLNATGGIKGGTF